MEKTNPKVDWYFSKDQKWKKEVNLLRTFVLGSGLTEELKWGHPCYTLEKSNVVLIHEFKEYCALLFMKGALMKDAKDILVQQTEKVQSARQIRFTSLKEIEKMKTTIKAYIKEAVAIEKAGLKVELKKTTEYKMPEEFRNELKENSELKTAFDALTPGRQRGYLLFFSSAKQSKTRVERVKKYTQQIILGKGLND